MVENNVPGLVALDIIEIFTHNESLYTYEVFLAPRPTTPYKNVHKYNPNVIRLKTTNQNESDFQVISYTTLWYSGRWLSTIKVKTPP